MQRTKENPANEHHAVKQKKRALWELRGALKLFWKDLPGKKDVIAWGREQSTLHTEILLTTGC